MLVLGAEELMHTPQRLAAALARALEPGGAAVLTSTTTRSPVLAVDAEGYAVRTALAFRAPDGPPGPGGERWAYNAAASAAPGARAYDEVLLVLDDAADPTALRGPGGLVPALAGACGRLTTVTLPAHRPGGDHR